MKRITDNINSSYINAANRLRPRRARQTIVAYVESYDDISFWRGLLDEFESKTVHFQVMLPSQTSLNKGKKQALMNLLGDGLGQNMIACVDSDYDYLLQGGTDTSRMINANPYVIQTYVYAIENFQCHAQCLQRLCVQSTLNDRIFFDLEEFMHLYSQIIYPLFVWNILLYRRHKLGVMSISDFCETVRIESVDLYKPQRVLEQLQQRVSRRLSQLERAIPGYKMQAEALKSELRRFGVTPRDTYLFIQGHHLMEHVALRMLAPVCTRLRKEREREISKLAMHDRQYVNELSAYRHSYSAIDYVLRHHTLYRETQPYQRLRRRVQELLDLRERGDEPAPGETAAGPDGTPPRNGEGQES